MKKLSLFLMMFFLTSVMGFSQTTVQKSLVKSSENEIVVDVKVGDFFMEEVETPNGRQVVINADDMASMLVKGAPDIPMFPISLIIDDKAEMAVSVVKSNYTDYENIEIAPSKGKCVYILMTPHCKRNTLIFCA